MGELHEHLDTIYGERLKGVYLYGSYARGDARDDSDIDVAIVLDKRQRHLPETRKVIGIVSELCLRENCLMVPFFLSEEEFTQTPYAIHGSIAREGQPV